jgi:hypothetical protein
MLPLLLILVLNLALYECHFKPDQYTLNTTENSGIKRKRLKPSAIPQIFSENAVPVRNREESMNFRLNSLNKELKKQKNESLNSKRKKTTTTLQKRSKIRVNPRRGGWGCSRTCTSMCDISLDSRHRAENFNTPLDPLRHLQP